MALILAVEPDRKQAAKITALARAHLRAEVTITETADQALAVLANQVPDLVLTSQLLSRKDDLAITDRLRDLDASGANIQTLVIPVLATAKRRSSSGRGILTRLRKKGNSATPDGCDPAVFAEQITEYLERAALEREARAESATTPRRITRERVETPAHQHVAETPIASDFADPVVEAFSHADELTSDPLPDVVYHDETPVAEPTPAIVLEPVVAVDPQPSVISYSFAGEAERAPLADFQPLPDTAVPLELEYEPEALAAPEEPVELEYEPEAFAAPEELVAPSAEAFTSAAEEEVIASPAEGIAPHAAVIDAPVEAVAPAHEEWEWEDFALDTAEDEPAFVLNNPMMDLDAFVQELEAEEAVEKTPAIAERTVEKVAARPVEKKGKAAIAELEAMEIAAEPSLDTKLSVDPPASLSLISWPRLEGIEAAGSSSDLMEFEVSHDREIADFVSALESMSPHRGPRSAASAVAEEVWIPFTRWPLAIWPRLEGATIKVAGSESDSNTRSKDHPAQDEWGFFDPEQCGFSALLAKLVEITDQDKSKPLGTPSR